MRLGFFLGFFFKITGKTCGKICIYLLKVHFKNNQQRTYLMFVRFFSSDFRYKSICCRYSFELHRQVDAIQIGTHNICLHKEVDKNYTGCNLELLDCALIGVCAVITHWPSTADDK